MYNAKVFIPFFVDKKYQRSKNISSTFTYCANIIGTKKETLNIAYDGLEKTSNKQRHRKIYVLHKIEDISAEEEKRGKERQTERQERKKRRE